jgi:hypothetical protein
MMRRARLPIEALPAWCQLNGVELYNVSVRKAERGKGSGLFATNTVSESHSLLLSCPRDLILSLESIRSQAKIDKHLRELLGAIGQFAEVNEKRATRPDQR